MSTPQPFHINISQADLDDLAARLARTRWPDELPGAAWDYGVAMGRVREVAAYWSQGYDWRAWEKRLNAVPQLTTVIDGQQVHFLHVRGGSELPLLLCHGWPSTPADFLELAGPLAGAGFDLVIPSMPGYGFSGPTTAPGWDVSRIARAYAVLMARLGYSRYGAHGGDWGARIVPELARADGEHVAAIHMNGFVAFPAADPGELTGPEQQRMARLSRWADWHRRVGRPAVPGSGRELGYPAGLLPGAHRTGRIPGRLNHTQVRRNPAQRGPLDRVQPGRAFRGVAGPRSAGRRPAGFLHGHALMTAKSPAPAAMSWSGVTARRMAGTR
ncbi:MAG: epoxide hydrolase [Streptosporangiaceae bacterium]|jgi:pimeloyl-ACP methyl ester carboxylesterase